MHCGATRTWVCPDGRWRFPLIFCYCLDREMDFLLIPFIHPALILFYTPLDPTEMACIRPLLHLGQRSLLRISPHSRYPDNTDRVDKTHIVFRHVDPLALMKRAKEKTPFRHVMPAGSAGANPNTARRGYSHNIA